MEPELTPSEQMLLDLIKEGRFDAEIAVRLGISAADLRRKTEALCRTLDVPDRQRLRAWEPSSGPEQAREPLPAPALGRSRRWPRVLAVAVAGIAAVVAAAFTLVPLVRSQHPAEEATPVATQASLA